MFLLIRSSSVGRTVEAGYATISLSGVGAELSSSATVFAGYAVISLSPETSPVVVTGAVTTVRTDLASESLDAALLAGHAPVARIVTTDSAGVVRHVYDPATITLAGSVTYDRHREVRRTANLTVVDVSGALAPTAYGDEFAPGELIRLSRGAKVGGQSIFELLGVYEISSFGSSLGGTLALTAEDTSSALTYPAGEVITIPIGTSAEDALRLLWEPVLGDGSGWDLDGGGMAVTTSRTISEDDERLHVAVQVMADLGLQVWMSRSGTPVLAPVADPNDVTPVRTWRQRAGEALATSLERRGDQHPFNRQVVIGENPSGATVRGVADVTDEASPIHSSRIGLRVAPIHRSAAITTQYQANQVAASLLIERSLWSDSVIWVGVPDPRIEAGDVVAIVDEQTSTDARYRVDRVTIPITTGAMSIEGSRVLPLFEAAP